MLREKLKKLDLGEHGHTQETLYKDLPIQDIGRKCAYLTRKSFDLTPFSKHHEPSGGHKWGPGIYNSALSTWKCQLGNRIGPEAVFTKPLVTTDNWLRDKRW